MSILTNTLNKVKTHKDTPVSLTVDVKTTEDVFRTIGKLIKDKKVTVFNSKCGMFVIAAAHFNPKYLGVLQEKYPDPILMENLDRFKVTCDVAFFKDFKNLKRKAFDIGIVELSMEKGKGFPLELIENAARICNKVYFLNLASRRDSVMKITELVEQLGECYIPVTKSSKYSKNENDEELYEIFSLNTTF